MAKTVVLLTASWCPRCPAARRFWKGVSESFGCEYREVDIEVAEGEWLAFHWGILAVPAAIVDGEVVNEVFDEEHALQLLARKEVE